LVKINWTNESKKWLKEIYDYIAKDNKNTAKRVINEIIAETEVLYNFPKIGQRLLEWPNREIRMLLYGHYRIVYIINSAKHIDILGIYHGALNLKRHLKS
jgi:toxin ParE1/3/4